MQTAGDATTRPATTAPPGTVVGVVLAGGRSQRMGRDKALLAAAGHPPTLAELTARRLLAVCGQVVVADAGRQRVAGLPSLPDAPVEGPAGGILAAAAAHPGRPLLVLACDLPRVPVALLAALAAAAPATARSPAALATAASATARPPADWVVPRWRRGIEPLCALYLPAALAALAGLAGLPAPAGRTPAPSVTPVPPTVPPVVAPSTSDSGLPGITPRALAPPALAPPADAPSPRRGAAPYRLRYVPGLRVRYLEGERLRRFGAPEELFMNLNTPADLERWLALSGPG